MFLNSAYTQREVIKSICGNISKDMETLKKKLLDFINESELEGKSYDSAKKYLDSTYIPLINGFILLSNEIVQAQEKFIKQYKSRVDVNSLQSKVLKNQIYRINRIIYELQSMTPFNSVVGFGIENMIFNYQYSKNKIEEKLEKLINFNDSSVEIFSDVESLLNDVKKGILEISSTGSWDSVNKVFISNSSNSEWATNLNDKYYKKELDLILNKIPNLTESDLAKIKEYGIKYPDEEVPQSIVDYIKANQYDLAKSLGQDIFSNTIEQTGVSIMKFGGLVNTLGSIKGPVGSNSFIIPNNSMNSIAQPIIKNGNKVKIVGKGVGGFFALCGFGKGIAYDIYNNEKSAGQAIAHNTTATVIGLGTSFIISNPIGWGVGATIGITLIATTTFEYAYSNNFLGIQSALDTVGGWVDEGFKKIGQAFR